ncbi:MAG: hypothetical protein AB7N80_05455 [Bdellovibrionales bacterium]
MRRTLSFIILFGLLIGCVERGKPVRRHEPAAATALVPAESRAAEVTTDIEALSLQSLTQELLRAEVIQSPKVLGQPQTQQKLWRLNEEILKAARSKTVDPATVKILEHYEIMLTYGCGETMSRCQHLTFFNLAKNSAFVAQQLALRHQDDLPRYYRLLQLAYTLKGSLYDSELATLMLKPAQKYLEILLMQDEQKARDFSHMLTTLTQQLIRRGNKAELQAVVQHLDLLNETSRKRMDDLGYSSDALIGVLAKVGGLSKVGTTEQSQERVAQYFASGNSLREVQNRLQKEHHSMLDQLGVQPIREWDLTLQLLDQAFLGQLTNNQALQLIAANDISPQVVAQKARQIYLLRFLEALAASNDLAQKQFFKQDVAGPNFFFHAIWAANEAQPIWDGFTSRLTSLLNLTVKLIRQQRGSEALADQTRQYFGGVHKNIKFMAVFPQMMALTYYLAKRNGKATIDRGWYTLEIDSSNLIEKLFLGQYKAWFNYSLDRSALSFVELLYSFDFALRTGVFEKFKVNPDEFVAEIAEKLLSRSTYEVNKYRLLLVQRTAGPHFYQFKRLCSQVDGGSISTTVNLRDLRLSPLYGGLQGSIFEAVSSKSQDSTKSKKEGDVEKHIQSLMLFDDNGFNTIAEEVRLDLGNVQRWLDGLVSSYQQYLERSGATGIDQRLKRSKAVLDKLHNLRVNFFRLGLGTFRTVGHCYMNLYHADEKVRVELLLREEAYLRQVHKELKRLRAGEVTQAQLKQEYGFKGLPSGFTGLDEFSKGGYRYNQVDVLLRIAQNLTKGTTLAGKTLPPIAPRMIVNYGGQLNIENELVGSLDKTERPFLPFLENEDEFVAQGMINLINYGNILAWHTMGSSRLTNAESRLHAATILYRLGDQKVIEDVCRPPMNCASEKELVSAQEIIHIHEQMLVGMRIDGEERRLMKMAGLPHKIDNIMLSRKMVDYDIINEQLISVWGLYDLPIRYASKPLLGADSVLQELAGMSGKDTFMAAFARMEGYKHFSYLRLGQLYKQIRGQEARRLFLIPISPILDQTMDKAVTGFIQDEIGRMGNFERKLSDHLSRVERLPEGQRPFMDISIEERVRTLITPSLLTDLNRQVNIFHRSTDYCFTNQGCDEFRLAR